MEPYGALMEPYGALFDGPEWAPHLRASCMQHPKVSSCWSPTLFNRPWGPNIALKEPQSPFNSLLE